MYEGREIEEIDTSVAGRYEVIVEAVDEIGRTSRKTILDLFIQNRVVEPHINKSNSIYAYGLVLTLMLSLGMASIIRVIRKKK